MLLDKFMPVYHFNEVHAIPVQAPAERTFRAIKEVTPAEIALFRILFAIRSLPARLVGGGAPSFAGRQPFLDQMIGAGFVLLGQEIDREIVLGTIGQFWKLFSGPVLSPASAQEFLAFERPEYAKAAMNFYLDAIPGGNAIKVRTETRVYVPDPATRRRFAIYWRLIYPGSALIRRMWLRAIKRRAEQGW